MKRMVPVVLLLATVACGGNGTSSTYPPVTPPVTPSGPPDVDSLARLTLPVGDAHCPTGGIQLTLNGGSVEYVCNGVAGPQGPAGPTGPAGSSGGTGGTGSQKQAGSRLSIIVPTMVTRTGSDGSSFPEYVLSSYGDFYDNQLRISCRIAFASDGTRRCLPFGGDLGGESVGSVYEDGWYFTDSSCTTRPWTLYGGTRCGVAGRYAVKISEDATVCPARSTVAVYSHQPFLGMLYEIVSTWTGTDANGCAVYTRTCTPVATPVATCGSTPSSPGPFVTVTTVPPSTFVQFNP